MRKLQKANIKTSSEFNLIHEEELINKNKAYIQSWIEIIEDEAQKLFKTITDTEK
ncbi:MAG: hypothetical protein U0L85_06130 [Bacilli bacterium]|nr:hypothetical protein [Bacilli bacterium]